MRSWAHIAFMYTALFHFITRATNLEVEKLFRDVDHIPKNPKQGYDDAWDLRRLWTCGGGRKTATSGDKSLE